MHVMATLELTRHDTSRAPTHSAPRWAGCIGCGSIHSDTPCTGLPTAAARVDLFPIVVHQWSGQRQAVTVAVAVTVTMAVAVAMAVAAVAVLGDACFSFQSLGPER